jgi:hypothetical protein
MNDKPSNVHNAQHGESSRHASLARASDPIAEAQALVDRLDVVLSICAVDSRSPQLIRLRMARAYVLGLRDELGRLDDRDDAPEEEQRSGGGKGRSHESSPLRAGRTRGGHPG